MTGEAEPALAAVHAHLLRRARTETDRILAGAHARADATVWQARRSAAEAIKRARAQGEAEAAPAAAAERSRGRRQARLIVLGARHEAYRALRAEILTAVGGLPNEPGFQRLRSRLATLASQAAGPGAAVTVQPDGGVVARSPGIVVDCTLARLASLAVDGLGGGVRELWTP